MDPHSDDDERRPLSREEASLVRRDIEDLAAFRETFEPQGYKGVSMFCDDCREDHFYGWYVLEGNLRTLLESGEQPVHEPPYDPRPEEYVTWDYARGYLDALADADMAMGPALRLDTDGCPHCTTALPSPVDHVVYCPRCGAHLGPARMAAALVERGWTREAVAELLRAAHIPVIAES